MIVTAPPKAVAVLPFVELARRDANAAAAIAAKLDAQVTDLRQSTASLRDGLAIATAEAKRLSTAKTATETELIGVYQMLESNNDKMTLLLTDVQAAWDLAGEQRDLRAKADENLSSLTVAASFRDAEAETLRLQHADMERANKLQSDEINNLENKYAASQKNAALGSYVKWAIGIAIVSFIGITIFKLIIAGAIPKISS